MSRRMLACGPLLLSETSDLISTEMMLNNTVMTSSPQTALFVFSLSDTAVPGSSHFQCGRFPATEGAYHPDQAAFSWPDPGALRTKCAQLLGQNCGHYDKDAMPN